MSILYCAIPYFGAALARRDNPGLNDRPLVLLDPQDRVFGFSRAAALSGVTTGMAARRAQIHCPEARLVEADIAQCRQEFESCLQLLERTSSCVEPHGWGAAYVDLGDMVPDRRAAIAICQESGRAVRRELGEGLQPTIGWNSTKFTAQAAARRTRPGNLKAVPAAQETKFLSPLPVNLLPLPGDAIRRLYFLGLCTLGQYALLPRAAVWQQFGKVGQLAHRYARGQDDRPVTPRWKAPRLTADVDLEHAMVDKTRLIAALRQILSPLTTQLQTTLRACTELRLSVRLDDDREPEGTRVFVHPTAELEQILDAVALLLDRVRWTAPAVALHVALEGIQDAVFEQLVLFEADRERDDPLRKAQQYLATRFGENHLKRAAVVHPHAPLPEWRVGWA